MLIADLNFASSLPTTLAVDFTRLLSYVAFSCPTISLVSVLVYLHKSILLYLLLYLYI